MALSFYIIGLDDSPAPQLSAQQEALVARHRVFSGGARHEAIMRLRVPQGATWIRIEPPMPALFAQYRAQGEAVVIFASGDPLFNGIAGTLEREFPGVPLEVYPAFHSLQSLCHRLLLPYQGMRVVSLTGRPWDALDTALIEGSALIGVLTDKQTHTPQAIAERMLHYGYDNYTMSVGERLGNPTLERVGTYGLSQVSAEVFAYPHCVVLRRQAERPRPTGIEDSELLLLDGRPKMLTKRLLRLLALAQLDLHNRRVLWDVGFCTGSVSIEARLQYPHVQVVAFERREEGRRLIEGNAARHGAPGITVVIGDFLQAELGSYPKPEAVFIGGHGGKLAEMVAHIAGCLKAGGIMVFNAVQEESRRAFAQAVADNGLELESSHTIALDSYNPITILKAVKWGR